MLDNVDILSIVTNELSVARTSETTNSDLELSLSYYLGLPDGREQEGKSNVTSTDVADAIEWIMPQIMKSFTQNNEFVTFDPIHPGDEKQAALETQYVYDVIMKQNDGFVVLHQFIKDALMQRTGILKIYYENEEDTEIIDLTGLIMEEVTVLQNDPAVEFTSLSERMDEYGQPVFDITAKRTSTNGKVVVDSVPPEEFRLNTDHNSILLDKARFTAHVVRKTVSTLVQEGYDYEDIKDLPYDNAFADREYRFQQQGESSFYEDNYSDDTSQRIVEVAECYMEIDINEDGISELVKVVVGGGDSPTKVLSVEEVPAMPWASTTAILMSHKFQGLSIFDRLREIQDQKTALWRNMFDNLYLQNNTRYEAVEGQVNMDDLMTSRAGGIVRVKKLGMVNPLITPQIGDSAQRMMQYLDMVSAGRTGVSAEGGTAPQDIGDRVGSQGVERLMTAKEELVGLIIRVVAETGIKPLCVKTRDLLMQHKDAIVDYKFRSEWTKINPKTWPSRSNCTVRVGTGTGDKQDKLAALQFVMQLQEKLLADPRQAMVDQTQIFFAIDEFCKASGLTGADSYFIDPMSQVGMQKAQQAQQMQMQEKMKNEKIQLETLQVQKDIAQAEIGKAQAQMQNVQIKGELEANKNSIQHQKNNYEAEISSLKTQLEEAKMFVDQSQKTAEMEFKHLELDKRTALELTRIEADMKKDQDKNFNENEEVVT
jgi:hypothetical protein